MLGHGCQKTTARGGRGGGSPGSSPSGSRRPKRRRVTCRSTTPSRYLRARFFLLEATSRQTLFRSQTPRGDGGRGWRSAGGRRPCPPAPRRGTGGQTDGRPRAASGRDRRAKPPRPGGGTSPGPAGPAAARLVPGTAPLLSRRRRLHNRPLATAPPQRGAGSAARSPFPAKRQETQQTGAESSRPRPRAYHRGSSALRCPRLCPDTPAPRDGRTEGGRGGSERARPPRARSPPPGRGGGRQPRRSGPERAGRPRERWGWRLRRRQQQRLPRASRAGDVSINGELAAAQPIAARRRGVIP